MSCPRNCKSNDTLFHKISNKNYFNKFQKSTIDQSQLFSFKSFTQMSDFHFKFLNDSKRVPKNGIFSRGIHEWRSHPCDKNIWKIIYLWLSHDRDLERNTLLGGYLIHDWKDFAQWNDCFLHESNGTFDPFQYSVIASLSILWKVRCC